MKKTILLFLFFLYSCIKQDDTVFKVSITDYYSNTPISNYEIEIFENSNWERTVKYFATNENGQVEYSVPYVKNAYYSVGSSRKVFQPDNWLYNYHAVSDLQSGHTNNIVFRLKKLSFLKLQLVDSSQLYNYVEIIRYQPVSNQSVYKGKITDTVLIVKMLVPEANNDIATYFADDSSELPGINCRLIKFYAPKVDTFYYRLAL